MTRKILLTFIAFVAISLIGLAVYRAGHNGNDEKSQRIPAKIELSNTEYAQILERFDSFAHAYFDRNAATYVGSIAQQDARFSDKLSSYVTPAFLDDQVPSLDTGPDQANKSASVGLVIELSESDYFGNIEAEREFELNFAGKLLTVPTTSNSVSANVSGTALLVKSRDKWYVSDLELNY